VGGGWSGGKTETSEGEGVRMGMGRVGGSAVVVVVGRASRSDWPGRAVGGACLSPQAPPRPMRLSARPGRA